MDTMPQQTKCLILAWGNPGRGDDAAGLVIAESLDDCVGDHVEIRCFHQLGPELSEDVAAADHVIFIDAHEQPAWPDLVVREVDPAADYTPDSHSSGPEELLGLAKALYHRQPRGTLVATRAYDTTCGAPLSEETRGLFAQAREVVLDLLAAHQTEPPVQS
jgi:hydrogenase maturation protease